MNSTKFLFYFQMKALTQSLCLSVCLCLMGVYILQLNAAPTTRALENVIRMRGHSYYDMEDLFWYMNILKSLHNSFHPAVAKKNVENYATPKTEALYSDPAFLSSVIHQLESVRSVLNMKSKPSKRDARLNSLDNAWSDGFFDKIDGDLHVMYEPVLETQEDFDDHLANLLTILYDLEDMLDASLNEV